MPSSTSSCNPAQLVAYADAMSRVNTDLLGIADHLARQIDRLLGTCREVPLTINPRLADPLAGLARGASERDEWVRGVAAAFACADQGPSLRESQLDLAREREAGAQQELNMVATVIDQSPLADTDRAQQNWQAWLHMWQARQLRAETLAGSIAVAEDDLRRAEDAFRLAILTNQPAGELAALQDRIADLRRQLAGDPAAATRVQELVSERHSLLMGKGYNNGLVFFVSLIPGGNLWTQGADWLMTDRLAEIEREIAALTPLVGLCDRHAWAVADLGAATAGLEQAEQRLVDATTRYYSDLALVARYERQNLADLKSKIEEYYPPGSPAYQALVDLEAVLDTPDSALFFQRYKVFDDLLDSDDTLSILAATDYRLGAFGNDPRLAVEIGRVAFAEQLKESPLKRGVEDLVLNIMLLGIPSLARNLSVLEHEGISPDVRAQYQVGLGMDIVGLLAMLAGPLSKAMGLVRGEGAALQLTDEGIAQLRAAGYSDEAIQALQARLAASESADVVRLLGPTTPEEMQAALARMRVPAPEAVYEAIVQKWAAKLDQPLSPEQLAMIRNEVARNDALLPRVFQDAPRNPAIDAYAEHVLDQYPIAYQNMLIENMDMNSVLVVRPRSSGAYLYDGLVPPKDMHVSDTMVLFKYDDGRRIITRDGKLETVLSDIDLADYVVRDQWMLDEVLLGPNEYVDRFIQQAGRSDIQHGTLMNGLIDEKIIKKLGQYDPATGTYATPERIVGFFKDEKVMVLMKNEEFAGYVDDMYLMDYLREFNPDRLRTLQQALPPEIWDEIIR